MGPGPEYARESELYTGSCYLLFTILWIKL